MTNSKSYVIIEWCHFQWPSVTPYLDLKVTVTIGLDALNILCVCSLLAIAKFLVQSCLDTELAGLLCTVV